MIFRSTISCVDSTVSRDSETDVVTETASISEVETMPRSNFTAVFNGINLHIKALELPSVTLKAKTIEHLRVLRDIRHENLNLFIGCYLDADSFSVVYEECSRGSLMSVLATEAINLDWEFKLSLITDLIRTEEC
ncbi:unnamed protein product [Rodentolepis nana]|uniref:PK_Tyr_Ser-Thr domain-containing protein n=1 Tax=Rodentolepis nana TaxID=102285 RepID=A0A0R3TH68_RODNA|nr:unnamed protein product [Rodentolepis nana]